MTATAEVIADTQLIIDASGVTICGPSGQGLPIISDAEGIRLNGFEDDGTFHLRGTQDPTYPGMREFP